MNSIEIQLNPKDFKDISTLSLQNEEGLLWINTVFNINREGSIPARFLRGFLPAFKLAEDIRKRSDGLISPVVRIFQPKNFSMLIDGVEQAVADQQQALAFSAISMMAQKHFPTSITKFEVDQEVNDEAMQILLNVAALIDISQDQGLINRLRVSGRRWGGESGEEKSLIYAAHHPFGWTDLHHPAFFETHPPQVVVNTLPPSEKKFTLIRDQILVAIRGTNLTGLIRGGERINLPLNICGAHYIPIKDEQGRKLEVDFEPARTMSCEDIIAHMQIELVGVKSGSIKSNLKKALIDLQTFMEDLSGTSVEDLRGVLFGELIGAEI